MNKVILMGRLAKDPEIRYSQGAEPVCVAKYRLAVNRRFRRDGEPDADFFSCVSFRRTAEFAERFLKRGMQIIVCGSLQERSFEDSSGQRKWVVEVVVEEAQFAESKAAFEARMASKGHSTGNDDSFPSPPPATSASYEPEGFSAITQSIDDDDLPF